MTPLTPSRGLSGAALRILLLPRGELVPAPADLLTLPFEPDENENELRRSRQLRSFFGSFGIFGVFGDADGDP